MLFGVGQVANGRLSDLFLPKKLPDSAGNQVEKNPETEPEEHLQVAEQEQQTADIKMTIKLNQHI